MKKHPALITASAWLSLLLTTVLVLFLMSSPALNLFSDNQSTPLTLLSGYRTQHILILTVLCLGAVLTGIFTVVSLVFGEALKDAFKLQLYAFFGALILLFGMTFGTHIPRTIKQLSEDIAQIQQNTPEQMTVWISPKSYAAQVTALVRTETVTRYAGIGEDTNHKWQEFYVPNGQAFSPTKDMLFDENKSISWNEENTPQYHITYTSHFRIMLSMEQAA